MFSTMLKLGSSRVLLLVLAIFLGIFVRFWQLDLRPFHHDESIHASLSYDFFKQPSSAAYKFDPTYHGPSLYILMRYAFEFLDFTSDSSTRLPITLVSFVIFLLPIIIHPFTNHKTVFWVVIFFSLSPTIVYFSRFLREDLLVITGIILTLWGFLKKNGALAGLGIALQVSTKANFYIHSFFVVAFLFWRFILLNWVYRVKFSEYFKSLFEGFDRFFWRSFLLGFLPLFLYLVTTEFRYWDSVWRVFVDSFSHWFEMHKKERIGGPFSFHFFILAWYEQVLFFATLIVVLHFQVFKLGKANFFSAANIIFCVTISLTGALLSSEFFEKQKILEDLPLVAAFRNFFKLKTSFDIYLCLAAIIYGILLSSYFVINKQDFLAVLAFSFFASFFTYSYVGEKVPWLSLYYVLPGYMFVAAYLTEQKKEELIRLALVIFVFVVAGVWIFSFIDSINKSVVDRSLLINILLRASSLLIVTSFFAALVWLSTTGLTFINKALRATESFSFDLVIIALLVVLTYRVNFSLNVREITLLSQVQTSRDLLKSVNFLSTLSDSKVLGKPLKVEYGGEATWPLAWYFKDRPFAYFVTSFDENTDADCIFFDEKENNKKFNSELVSLRSWWVPDYEKITFKNFILYMLTNKPFSEIGHFKVRLSCKINLFFQAEKIALKSEKNKH